MTDLTAYDVSGVLFAFFAIGLMAGDTLRKWLWRDRVENPIVWARGDQMKRRWPGRSANPSDERHPPSARVTETAGGREGGQREGRKVP